MRPGDNMWTASRIAIDPENGEIKWGFQTTPHDGWDYRRRERVHLRST